MAFGRVEFDLNLDFSDVSVLFKCRPHRSVGCLCGVSFNFLYVTQES
jgi:hypothetical protein